MRSSLCKGGTLLWGIPQSTKGSKKKKNPTEKDFTRTRRTEMRRNNCRARPEKLFNMCEGVAREDKTSDVLLSNGS